MAARTILAAALAFTGGVFAQGLPQIEQAWTDLLPAALPEPPVKREAPADFLNHFFLETRTDYWRYSTGFTGLPTVSSVIDAPFTGVFNPKGIPYPDAFQPAA